MSIFSLPHCQNESVSLFSFSRTGKVIKGSHLVKFSFHFSSLSLVVNSLSPLFAIYKMDRSKLSISKPVLKDNGYVPKHYLQHLKYENGPLYFQSSLFYSNGPRLGLNKNYQLCVTLTPEVRKSLKLIEEYVADNIELPSVIAEKWEQYAASSGDTHPFKPLYDGESLFMKMGMNVSLYNLDELANGKYQSFEHPPPLGAGWYVVYFSVPAIYLGSHNANPKVASLQLRIEQIAYRPKPAGECNIQPVSLSTTQPLAEEVTVDDFIEEIFSEEKPVKEKQARKRSKKVEKKKTDSLQNVLDDVVAQN